jgi:hypothetical protein
MPRRTSLLRSVITCTTVTRRCILLPPRINESSPSHSSREALTFALVTEEELAVQNTGRSDSASDAAKDEQARIIAVLIGHGASPTDADANGRSVADTASSERVRDLLGTS